MRKLILLGAALWSLTPAPASRAALLLSESFNYTNGPLVTVSAGGWVHHSGATIGEVLVVSGKALLSQTNVEDVAAQLQGQPYPPTTNIFLYASFTVNFLTLPTGSSGAYFAHFKAAGATGFADKIYATTNGAPNGSFRIGVANNDNTTASILINSNLSLQTDYQVVTRYTVSNGVSTVWLAPSAETDPSVTATDSVTTITVTTFALRESFASPNGMGTLYLDNLLVGTSFSDVVSPTGPVAPTITTQPQSQAVFVGSNATFSVVAGGTAPLSYQWQFYGTNLPTATTSTLTLLGVSTNDAGPYSVIVTNSAGATNSQPATLTVIPFVAPPSILTQPQSQLVSEGANVTFTVVATGDPPLAYQWRFNGTNLAGATDTALTLNSVTVTQAGTYSVTVTNPGGATNSQPATLTVNPAAQAFPALSYVTYNMKGNGAATWSTNAPQVQAIGHELMYLNPDIITFNEIPNTFRYEMTNFIIAFLPGYYLAVSTTTDGFIRNGVASRFPILAAQSHLHSDDLSPYGYTNADFTRDLFEAQVQVPNFPQPLHVFAVHLKSGQGTDDSNRRTAECSAISNYFATVFLPTNNNFHPYVMSGDMNEDIDDPPASNPRSIQKLISAPTGLRLTSPVNPFTSARLTFSIQNTNGLSQRYDYIMPSGLLYSNINSSQVFRTDLLVAPPPPLLTNDDVTASDHLPVQMIFNNPYAKPFRLLSFTRINLSVGLTWESIPGQPYRVEFSSNLTTWSVLADNLTATAPTLSFATNRSDPFGFFRVYRIP